MQLTYVFENQTVWNLTSGEVACDVQQGQSVAIHTYFILKNAVKKEFKNEFLHAHVTCIGQCVRLCTVCKLYTDYCFALTLRHVWCCGLISCSQRKKKTQMSAKSKRHELPSSWKPQKSYYREHFINTGTCIPVCHLFWHLIRFADSPSWLKTTQRVYWAHNLKEYK